MRPPAPRPLALLACALLLAGHCAPGSGASAEEEPGARLARRTLPRALVWRQSDAGALTFPEVGALPQLKSRKNTVRRCL